MSPPYPLRRLAFLWAPLLVAGVLFFALAPFYAAAWCLIPITLVTCAILAELTDHTAPHKTHPRERPMTTLETVEAEARERYPLADHLIGTSWHRRIEAQRDAFIKGRTITAELATSLTQAAYDSSLNPAQGKWHMLSVSGRRLHTRLMSAALSSQGFIVEDPA